MDNIFDLFGPQDNLDGVDNSTTLMDFKITPSYWIGMYNKLILNHLNFNKQLLQFLKKTSNELDSNDMKEASEFITYNRAWSYIKKINIEDKNHIKSIKIYKDKHLTTSLQLSIDFFINTEQYERCAHLQKILNFISE